MIEQQYDLLEIASKVNNIYRGCLLYLRYLNEGGLKDKLDDIIKYFRSSEDVIDKLIESGESKVDRYFIWMDRTTNDKTVDEMIKELRDIRKILRKIPKGEANKEEAEKARRVINKISSYFLIKSYNELLGEVRKYVIRV